MLQQTTVATVTSAVRAVRRALADDRGARGRAATRTILSEWAGLGYYARARNLIACAREVARRGGFPQTAAELRTAAGHRRLYLGGDRRDRVWRARAGGRHQRRARDRAAQRAANGRRGARSSGSSLAMMPADRPGDFVQAMMDLGATICRPKHPRCGECPLRARLRRLSPAAIPRRFPERTARAPPAAPTRRRLLDRARRPGLAGAPPGQGPARRHGRAARQRLERRSSRERVNALGTVRHVFTHFSLDLARRAARRAGRRGLVAAARPARRGRACRRSIAAPPSWRSNARRSAA